MKHTTNPVPVLDIRRLVEFVFSDDRLDGCGLFWFLYEQHRAGGGRERLHHPEHQEGHANHDEREEQQPSGQVGTHDGRPTPGADVGSRGWATRLLLIDGVIVPLQREHRIRVPSADPRPQSYRRRAIP